MYKRLVRSTVSRHHLLPLRLYQSTSNTRIPPRRVGYIHNHKLMLRTEESGQPSIDRTYHVSKQEKNTRNVTWQGNQNQLSVRGFRLTIGGIGSP